MVRDMRNKTKTFLLLSLFVLLLFVGASQDTYIAVHSAPSVQFVLENTFWGNPPNNVITVSPGDTNVPLTIIIRNNSSNTLRGVIGELSLPDLFTDYVTGSNVSKVSAQPVESGDVLNQTGDILPSGSFTFTFQLNIDDNATKGVYYGNLTIYYNIEENGVFVPGEPQKMRIPIRLPNRSPVIYSVNPTAGTITVPVGQFVNFSCYANDPDGDNVTYEWTLDGNTVGYGQNFTYYATRSDVGSHTLQVKASDGNLSATNSWTINVVINPVTTLSISTNYLYGGSTNQVTINITNDIWVGRVQVSLTSQQYLVIIGNSSWTIDNVRPNDTISISARIFAPESIIGQTMQIGLTVSYSDNYGSTYSENYGIGFVIRGKIVLRVYGIIINPEAPRAGEKFSISGTILNVGNVKAMFTNVSLMPNPILTLDYESSSYIGDVDPNSPVPFTLTAYIKPNTANKTYIIGLLIKYTDDLYNEHNFTINVPIKVMSYQANQGGNNQQTGSNVIFTEGEIAMIGTIITVVAVGAILYFRRRA